MHLVVRIRARTTAPSYKLHHAHRHPLIHRLMHTSTLCHTHHSPRSRSNGSTYQPLNGPFSKKRTTPPLSAILRQIAEQPAPPCSAERRKIAEQSAIIRHSPENGAPLFGMHVCNWRHGLGHEPDESALHSGIDGSTQSLRGARDCDVQEWHALGSDGAQANKNE